MCARTYIRLALRYISCSPQDFRSRNRACPFIAEVLNRTPVSPTKLNVKVIQGALPRGPEVAGERCGVAFHWVSSKLEEALGAVSLTSPTPATLLLRVIANIIDGAVSIPVFFLLRASHLPDVGQRAIFSFYGLAYYSVMEGFWGASLGKVGLWAESSAARRQRSRFLAGLYRAGIFCGNNFGPTLVVVFFHVSSNAEQRWSLAFDLLGDYCDCKDSEMGSLGFTSC